MAFPSGRVILRYFTLVARRRLSGDTWIAEADGVRMVLPGELVHIVDQAHMSIVSHPLCDLTLGYRRAIWTAMGACAKKARADECPGWRRRVVLAKTAAQFVVPIWRRIWPNDDTPQRLIAAAERVLNGALNREAGEAIWYHYWEASASGSGNPSYQTAWAVVASADQALAAALWDERFDPSVIDYGLSDADVDPDEMDSSFFAAVAYAGGAVWDADSDPNKRRQFWDWWLAHAVPTAFHSSA